MAYENLELLLAGVSGEIYLTRQLKGGTMSDTRRVMTDDCLRASTEWFMRHDKKMIQYNATSAQPPTLFFTQDPAKIKQILAILEGGN